MQYRGYDILKQIGSQQWDVYLKDDYLGSFNTENQAKLWIDRKIKAEPKKEFSL